MKFNRIFVTVGTTEFTSLVEKLSDPDVYDAIKNQLGCEELTLQIGNGKKIDFGHFEGIKVETFSLKDSIAGDIEAADLVTIATHDKQRNFSQTLFIQVISHAGAGTCIDVLSRGKPLIVVINETLMNNHQTELAEQLSNDGYLFHTTVQQLLETLKTFDISKLKKYEKGNVDKFIEYLNDAMGFV